MTTSSKIKAFLQEVSLHSLSHSLSCPLIYQKIQLFFGRLFWYYDAHCALNFFLTVQGVHKNSQWSHSSNTPSLPYLALPYLTTSRLLVVLNFLAYWIILLHSSDLFTPTVSLLIPIFIYSSIRVEHITDRLRSIASSLVDHAVDPLRSLDNVTVMIVLITDPTKPWGIRGDGRVSPSSWLVSYRTTMHSIPSFFYSTPHPVFSTQHASDNKGTLNILITWTHFTSRVLLSSSPHLIYWRHHLNVSYWTFNRWAMVRRTIKMNK